VVTKQSEEQVLYHSYHLWPELCMVSASSPTFRAAATAKGKHQCKSKDN
jgi:hypothetical protein